VSLKQDIERELHIPVQIKMGSPGSLNVFANGKKVFSYQETHKHPKSPEIIALLRGLTTNS